MKKCSLVKFFNHVLVNSFATEQVWNITIQFLILQKNFFEGIKVSVKKQMTMYVLYIYMVFQLRLTSC